MKHSLYILNYIFFSFWVVVSESIIKQAMCICFIFFSVYSFLPLCVCHPGWHLLPYLGSHSTSFDIYIYIRSLPQLPSGNVERIEKHASVAYSYEGKWKVKKKISTHILKTPFGVSSIHTLYKLNECPYPWSSDSWHEYHLFLFGIYGMLLFFFKKF